MIRLLSILHAGVFGSRARYLGVVSGMALLAYSVGQTQPRTAAGSAPNGVAVQRAFASGPIRFVENRGQVVDTRGKHRPDILYTATSGGTHLFLRNGGFSYVFTRWVEERDAAGDSVVHSYDLVPHLPSQPAVPSGYLEMCRVDMELIGANPHAGIVPGEPTGDRTNYYLPQCPDGITGIPGYGRLTYRDIYQHIDLVIYSFEGHAKYDFVVHRGGRVGDIRWRYAGADGASIRADGVLRVHSALGGFDEEAPYAYQELADGKRRAVRCGYRAGDTDFGYDNGAYDAVADLVIDPALQWATYFGGSGSEQLNGESHGIATYPNADVCAAASTLSIDFPVTPGAMQAVNKGLRDIVMFRIASAGNLLWSTYWGGSNTDFISGIACDSLGNCAVTGYTFSSDFPVGAGGYQPALVNNLDAVLGMFDGNGVRKWATFLGGGQSDDASGVAFDSQRNIIISGSTTSLNFPVKSPFQGAIGGIQDGYIAKFSPGGALIWSTFYGGSQPDLTYGVVVDRNDDIVVSGPTQSANLSMFGTPFQPAFRGTGLYLNSFILRLASNGTPKWSTYYSGSAATLAYALAIDTSGAAIVTGYTEAPDLPTNAASFQRVSKGGFSDGFVAKFSAGGRHIWSTYLGGSGQEIAYSVIVTGSDIVVGGYTASTDFPVTPGAYQPLFRGALDAFIFQLDSGGTQALWGTYYGGTQSAEGLSVAFGAGSIYLLGYTNGNDLPGTANGFQPASKGNFEGFIVKFDGFCPGAPPSIDASGTVALCEGDSATLTGSAGFTNFQWAPNNEATQKIVVKTPGTYSFTARDGNGCIGASNAVRVLVNKKPVPVITPAGPITMCLGDSVQLSVKQNGFVKFQWSVNSAPSAGDTLDHVWVKQAGIYDLRVVDTNGCVGGSAPVSITINPLPQRPVLSSVDTVVICPDSAFTLDAGPGYTAYFWSPSKSGSRTERITKPGLYYVDVANASGCSARSDSVVVLAYPVAPVRIVVNGSLDLCSGDSVTLRIPPGAFTVPRWSNGSAADSLVVRATGLYYVTVTDGNGCSERSDTIRVTAYPAVKADIAGPSSICRNAVVAYSTSGAGTLRYAWSLAGDGSIQGAGDGSGISVQWGASGGGKIILVVTDPASGCSATSTRDVTIGTSLTPVIAPANPVTICSGDSVQLDAGAGYTSYTWSNGARSRTIWIKDSVGYAVTVADASGCIGTSDTLRARVEDRPSPVITGIEKVCVSTSGVYTVADVPGASYVWQVSGGAIASGAGTSNITVQWGSGSSGTVDVTVTSVSGCSGSAVRKQVEIGSSLKPVITPGGNLDLCAGDSLVLDAGGGYASYQWSSGEISEQIVVRQSGSYAVTVRDATGCGGTSDTVRVTVHQAPVATITPAGPIVLAAGDSVVLDAGSGYSNYLWTKDGANAGSAQQLIARDSGSYAVRITDANGCTGSAAVLVTTTIKTETSGTAELALGDAEAKAGDHVEIPLRLIGSSNLAGAGASRYEARVRYRASMLIPSGSTPRGTISGIDRVLTVTGDVPAGMTSGDLGNLEFIAALGDTDRIGIALENVTWRGADGAERNVTSVLHGSAYHLIGLCTSQSTRLIEAGGSAGLKAVIPNPASGEVRVEYELLEDGYSRVWVSDLLGREVAVIAGGASVHGSHSATFDAGDLASGLYMVVLQSGTNHESVFMEIAR